MRRMTALPVQPVAPAIQTLMGMSVLILPPSGEMHLLNLAVCGLQTLHEAATRGVATLHA
jgi:hypothetical protein